MVISLLHQHFVNTWALVVDLKALEKDESDLEMSQFAKMLLADYEFPVMMMVISPQGKIVHKINANTFLEMETSFFESGLQNPSTYLYERFLREALEKLEVASDKAEGFTLPAA